MSSGTRRYALTQDAPLRVLAGSETLTPRDLGAGGIGVDGCPESKELELRFDTEAIPPIPLTVKEVRRLPPEGMVFDETSRNRLEPLLQEFEKKGWIQPLSHRLELEQALEASIWADSGGVHPFPKPEHALWWFRRNPDLWKHRRAVFACLRNAFPHHFVSRHDFGEYMSILFEGIGRDAAALGQTLIRIDCVPLRTFQALSAILTPHANRMKEAVARIAPAAEVHFEPNLYDFLNQERSGEGGSAGRWLVALDSFVNRGRGRRAFLSLLERRYSKLLQHYSRLYLAAVVGYDEGPDSGRRLTGCHVIQRLGKPGLGDDSRPFSSLEPAEQEELQRLLQSSGLAGRGRGTASMKAKSTFVSFYYGCPEDALPIFWAEKDEWTPLCRLVEYYEGGAEPLARAPLYSGRREALDDLRRKIRHHEPVLLYGPCGVGKSYLAARALEESRTEAYLFWHDCVDFETIENILDHLDSFFKGLGLPGELAAGWRARWNEKGLADHVAEHLTLLDRSAILVLDGIRNVAGPRNDSEPQEASDRPEAPLWLFLKHLLGSLAQRRGSAVSEPSLVFIYRADYQDPNVDKVAKDLGITRLTYALVEKDLQDWDPALLAKKLLLAPALVADVLEQIRSVVGQDPYRTWLLCFVVNRFVREATGATWSTLCKDLKEGPLDRLQWAQLDSIEKIHGHVDLRFLSEDDLLVLQVASAFALPFAVADVKAICDRLPPQPAQKDPGAAIGDLIRDRAPFFTRLGTSRPSREPALYSPRLGAGPGDERLEMPSVTRVHYAEMLRGNEALARRVHSAMASLIEDQLRGASAGMRNGMLRVRQIVHYCAAGQAHEAAVHYTDGPAYRELAEQNSWDRIGELGRLILRVFPQGDSASTEDEPLAYLTTAVYANTLTETRTAQEAFDVCSHTLECWPTTNPYLRARLWLIQAKCRRYLGEYEEAVHLYRQALDALAEERQRTDPGRVSDEEVDWWRCRAHNAMSQVQMSLARMGEAQDSLEATEKLLAGASLARSERALKIRMMLLRHRGTIHLLRGDLPNARERFEELLKQERRSQPFRAGIALYKLARVDLEEARRMEVAGGPGPSDSRLQSLLKSARTRLADGRDLLKFPSPAYPRWSAATDLARVEDALLSRRTAPPDGATHPEADFSEAERALARVRASMRSFGVESRSSRALEADILEASMSHERRIEELAARLASESDLRSLMNAVCSAVPAATDGPNPYVRSRAYYERSYYLWRIEKLRRAHVSQLQELSRELLDAISASYREGTRLLYHAGLFEAGTALHLLAVSCFEHGPLGLQERLEASLWLRTERSPCRVADETQLSRIPTFPAIMALIASNAIEHADLQGDDYFTIPTKVHCRLLGRACRYDEVVEGRRQPVVAEEDERSSDRPRELDLLARELRDDCIAWVGSISGAHKGSPPSRAIDAYLDDLGKHPLDQADWYAVRDKMRDDILALDAYMRCVT